MKFPWSRSSKSTGDEKSSSEPSEGPTKESSHIVETPATDIHKTPPLPVEDAEERPVTKSDHDESIDPHEISQPDQDNEKRQVVQRTDSTATASSAGDFDDPSKYKSGVSLYLLTFGLAMSTFVVALDNTIIATAIPRITTVFDSLNDVGWYGSSYLLTTTSLQPSFGKIYTYFNVKWTYIIALFIFEVGSVLCGAAVSSEMLIVGRAVAGVGASALFSGGMTIVAYSVPLHRRPIYIGLLSSMFGIASVVGPILGGAFTDRVSWRWCFYINLPVGAIAMAAVYFFFQNPERKESELTFTEKLKQVDLLGAGFLISAIICLLLALQVSASNTFQSIFLTLRSGEGSSIHGPTRRYGAVSSGLDS